MEGGKRRESMGEGGMVKGEDSKGGCGNNEEMEREQEY